MYKTWSQDQVSNSLGLETLPLLTALIFLFTLRDIILTFTFANWEVPSSVFNLNFAASDICFMKDKSKYFVLFAKPDDVLTVFTVSEGYNKKIKMALYWVRFLLVKYLLTKIHQIWIFKMSNFYISHEVNYLRSTAPS